ncbi:TIR domain-containing protein [Erythrobacter sp. HKB08]|uniref:TIR domain-containing protein n=1 Tax=Erythrobacter sp. HKB08 TaxID=2502843 RepID=UPI0013E8C1EE|nr:TIR domain-containing protein [Erythrobacter sp. HKB08]
MDSDTSSSDQVTAFVSYRRGDRERAVSIIETLEDKGISVWWDGLLAGGDRYAQTTEAALETANAVVVLWSGDSIESHWVRDEATRGRDRGCMVSVSLDGTEPPLGFRQVQYIDFSGWKGGSSEPQFTELLHAIEHVAKEPGTELTFRPASAGKQGGISRRAILAGSGVVALGAAGVLAWRGGIFGGGGADGSSIAVMPFENLSADPEQAYFSDGLAEELRNTLSLNRRIAVAAQTSTNSFRDGEETAMEIAQALGVSHILEGSVRRTEEQLRVSVRLIEGGSGFEAWGETFERALDNVLDVQSEIAALVVDSLVSAIGEDARAGTERVGGTSSADALDAYLRGVALYELAASEETDRQALAAFEQAIELDPDYAAAHAARARVLTVIGSAYAKGKDLAAYYDEALAAARRAVESAPELAEGHAALGLVLANARLDMAGARQPYDRSFELGFGNATVLNQYGIYASQVGDFEKGREAVKRAERLDPLNPGVFRTEMVIEFAAGDYEAATRAANRALALNPEIGSANRFLGDIAYLQGDIETAKARYEAEPMDILRLPGLAIAARVVEGEEAGDAALAELVESYGDNSFYQQAQVLVQFGREDEALAALEAGRAAGDSGLTLMLTDPLLAPIRQEPRFEAVSASLGLS